MSSTIRSRAAFELENLALRHQIAVLQRSARKRLTLTSWRPPIVGPAVPYLGRLALGTSHTSIERYQLLFYGHRATSTQTRLREQVCWSNAYFSSPIPGTLPGGLCTPVIPIEPPSFVRSLTTSPNALSLSIA